MIAVPRRNVEPDLQPSLPAGVRHLAHQIALPVAERRSGNVVRRRLRRPETEPVVMFADDDDSREPAVSARLRNLIRAEIGRIEDPRVVVSESPLFAGEGVEAEMHDCVTAVPAVQNPRSGNASRIEM